MHFVRHGFLNSQDILKTLIKMILSLFSFHKGQPKEILEIVRCDLLFLRNITHFNLGRTDTATASWTSSLMKDKTVTTKTNATREYVDFLKGVGSESVTQLMTALEIQELSQSKAALIMSSVFSKAFDIRKNFSLSTLEN